MRKEYYLCEHDINIKINKTLSFCQNCVRITLIQKSLIITKFFVKSKLDFFLQINLKI